MRFFHRGFANGDIPDLEADRQIAAYRARLEDISPDLPEPLRALSRINLHDGLVERIEWTPHCERLVIELLAGSQPDGYFIATLTFLGAMVGEHRYETLRDIARDRRVELLYDEIDLAHMEFADGTPTTPSDPGFVYRMLFSPSHELTLDFTGFELSTRPVADRRIAPGQAFLELSADDFNTGSM